MLLCTTTYLHFESYFHEFFSFLFVKFLFSSHKSKVHGKKSKKFQCTVCDLQCPNRSKLKTHIEEVHEKIKVSCPHCQKLFSKGGLRNHIKYYHEVDRISKPFKCDECEFASHAMKYLKGTSICLHFFCFCLHSMFAYIFSPFLAHKLNCHDKSKQKYKCDHCGDRFPFPSHLKLHQCRGTKSGIYLHFVFCLHSVCLLFIYSGKSRGGPVRCPECDQGK